MVTRCSQRWQTKSGCQFSVRVRMGYSRTGNRNWKINLAITLSLRQNSRGGYTRFRPEINIRTLHLLYHSSGLLQGQIKANPTTLNVAGHNKTIRSEEHTSELQSLR